ncbi:MAG: hypothetical protein BWZ03_00312 [bacterium ADurb.BinA186]|nr:MAG: hypothetical protein BWZ03_00312 [bacterium ADurb.BinA186]
MKKFLLKILFIMVVLFPVILLNNCVENIGLNHDLSKPPEKNEQEDPKKNLLLVDCSKIPDAERREAFDASGGDYGMAGPTRLLDGSSFALMKLVDAPVWTELSPWLEAQKDKKKLAQRYKEWPGIQDMIKKSNPELAKAFYCLSEAQIEALKKSNNEYENKLLETLKISCKEAMNAGNAFSGKAINNCRKEYMSLYLDLLALENAR